MELTLLGTVAVAVFLLAGATVMLLSAFRRTIQLRQALIEAMARIENLEAAIVAGKPLNVTVSASHAEAVASLAQEAPKLIEGPRIQDIAAEVEAQDHIEPPGIGVIAVSAVLATFTALAAAHVRALSGQGGVVLTLLIGGAVIAAGEWRRRTRAEGERPRFNTDLLVILLGLGLMLVAILYGRWSLGAVHPPSAVFGLAALSFAAMALSFRYGAPLLLLALTLAGVAPAMSLIQAPGAWGQYAFLLGFTGLMFWTARRRGAPIFAWLALAPALFWGANLVFIGGAPFNVGIGGLYFAALAAFGLSYAWPSALALPFPRFWSASWREPIVLGHLLAVAASILLAALLLQYPTPATYSGAAILAYAAIAVGAASLRPGLWLAQPLAVVTTAASIAFWPAGESGLVDAPNLVVIAASLACLFALGGWATMAQNKDARPGAALAAFGPLAILVAANVRISGFGGEQVWAGAALILALIDLICFMQLKRAPNAASAFAAAGALAAVTALAIATPAPYQPLALALSLPLIAVLARWRAEPGLKLAAAIIGVALLLTLLAASLKLDAQTDAMTPILFAASVAGALLASFIFARRGAARDADASAGAFALAMILGGACVSFVARRAFTDGVLGAPYQSLAEVAINTTVWLGLALLIAWRFGARASLHVRAIETFVLVAAAAHVLLVGGVLINPWWGARPALTSGWPLFNLIEAAFAAPALLLFAYAWIRRRQGLDTRSDAAFALGLVLAFLTLALELRRLYHGAAMASAPILIAEAWTYSAAALGFAALMLAIAAERSLSLMRYASLALALIALGKMAFFDLGALDGVLRLVGFVVIAAIAGGLIFFYRRFVLPAAPNRPKTVADPEPAPPS